MAPNDTNLTPGDASNAINTKANSIMAPITISPRGKSSIKKLKYGKFDLSTSSTDRDNDKSDRASSLDLDLGSSLQPFQSGALNETTIDYLDDVDDYLNDVCDDKCYASNSGFNSSNNAYDVYDPYDADYDFPAAYNAGRSSKEGDTRPGKYTNKGIRRILATLDKASDPSTEGKQADESKDGRAGSKGGKKKKRC